MLSKIFRKQKSLIFILALAVAIVITDLPAPSQVHAEPPAVDVWGLVDTTPVQGAPAFGAGANRTTTVTTPVTGQLLYRSTRPEWATTWVLGLSAAAANVRYGVNVHRAATLMPHNSTVNVGDVLDFSYVRDDPAWSGTGRSMDTPWGEWRAGAASSGRSCNAIDFFGSAARTDIYIEFVADPGNVTISHAGTAGLSCNGDNSQCTVTSAGSIDTTVDFAATYGNFYYDYIFTIPSGLSGCRTPVGDLPMAIDPFFAGVVADPLAWIPDVGVPVAACGARTVDNSVASYDPCSTNAEEVCSNSGGGDLVYTCGAFPISTMTGGIVYNGSPLPAYDLTIPAGQVTYSLNAVGGSGGSVPNQATISGPTSGDTNVSHSFTFTATDSDGDNIFYEVDWDNNGSVDQLIPSAGTVTSGTPQNGSRTWTTAGDKDIRVRAVDTDGNGPWSAVHTITISVPSSAFTGDITADGSNGPITVSSGSNVSLDATFSGGPANGWCILRDQGNPAVPLGGGYVSASPVGITVNPTVNTTYELYCGVLSASIPVPVVSGGSTIDTVTVNISGGLFNGTLTATPGSITVGDSVDLDWVTDDTWDGCHITGTDGSYYGNPNYYVSPASPRNITVSPTTTPSVTYTLWCGLVDGFGLYLPNFIDTASVTVSSASNDCDLIAGHEQTVTAPTTGRVENPTNIALSGAPALAALGTLDTYENYRNSCETWCDAANALYCDFDYYVQSDGGPTPDAVIDINCTRYDSGGIGYDADDDRLEGEPPLWGPITTTERHDADYCGPNATLSVNPGTYPYPNTAIGASVNPTHTFWVTNTGGGTLSGSVSIPAGAFSCTGGCSYNNLTSASAPHAVTIEFDPSAVTSYSETAVFSSDAGPNVNVSLSGDGVADPDPDPIVAFWSNDPTINLGDSSELEWDNVSGGGGIPDDCTIEDLTSGTTWGPGAPISPEDFGTYDVTPATTRDYRLRCENNGGASSDQAEVTVTVNLPTSAPLIAEDGANTRRISDLQNYDLTNAIDPEGDDIRYGVDWDSDDIVDEWVPAAGYAPSGSALVATRDWNVGVASGVGTKNVQVKAEDDQGASSPWSPVITFDILNPLPNIILTVAPPSPLFSGDATNVSWTATDATTCQTLETVPAGGWDGGPTNHGLPPGNQDTNGLTLDTDFPVECTGAGGTVSATATIRVLPGIGNFTHTPEPVVEGGDITLNWDPVVGSNVSCEGRRNFGSAIGWDGTARSSAGGADTLGGVFVDSQYELRCENTAITPQTWAAEQTDVTVAFPIVSTFEALPQQVLKGKQSQIVWNVANLEGLYIYRQASSEAASTSVHTNEVFPVTEDNSGVPHDTIPIDEPVTYTLVGAPLIGPHIIETFTITPFVPGFEEE